jgi:hypothetical protein
MTLAVLGTTNPATVRLRRSDSTAGARARIIPPDELWLWQDAEALASLFQGIEEARRGEEVEIELSDLEIDDE